MPSACSRMARNPTTTWESRCARWEGPRRPWKLTGLRCGFNRSMLIFTSYFDPAIPQSEIVAELRRWNATHCLPLRSEWRPHQNDPSADRKLRIGYVSPDFRDHVVGRTLLPCFEAHDRERFDF